MASGPRTAALRRLEVPTVVIHGESDSLVLPRAGLATARAIPNARVLTIPGMGHNLPEPLWPTFVDAIVKNAERAAVSQAGGRGWGSAGERRALRAGLKTFSAVLAQALYGPLVRTAPPKDLLHRRFTPRGAPAPKTWLNLRLGVHLVLDQVVLTCVFGDDGVAHRVPAGIRRLLRTEPVAVGSQSRLSAA